jgi:predicted ATPase
VPGSRRRASWSAGCFAEIERVERIHEEVHLEHGYRLIEVPAGTVAQRVRQVLRVITI